MFITQHGIIDSVNNLSPLTVLTPGDGTTNWSVTGSVTVGLGFLEPTNSSVGWNKGASFGTVPSNTDFSLSMEVTVKTVGYATGNKIIIAGMGETDPDGGFGSILFAWQVFASSDTDRRTFIRVNGVSTQYGSGATGWMEGDTFEIKRVSGSFEFYQNGNLIASPTAVNNNALIFDSSINNDLGMENITITY